jgi:uncharacterized protein
MELSRREVLTWSALGTGAVALGNVGNLAGATADRDHGFVFEVDPGMPSNNLLPTPLAALGRFAHEAVVVDPQRGDLYLTEDGSSPNGLVYRFAPNDRSQTYGALRNSGTLTAMSCSLRGTPVPDLSVFSTSGTSLGVEWIAVPDPQAQTVSIRRQFANAQITRSRKFEGAWWGDATGNGKGSNSGHGRGNRKAEKAHIVCSFADAPDNICVSP